MKETYHDALKLHLDGQVTKTIEDTKTARYSMEQMGDNVLLAKKTKDLLTKKIKQLNELITTSEKLVCYLWSQRGDLEPIRGEISTSTPRITTSIQIPSRTNEPEKYDELCKALGLQDNPLMRLHYPSIKEELTRLQVEGKPIPKGVKELGLREYEEYALSSRSTVDLPSYAGFSVEERLF